MVYRRPQPGGDYRDMLNLRAELLSQTSAVVRRQRYWRRGAILAACAGCYLAGWLTVTFIESAVPPPPQKVVFMLETVQSPDAAGAQAIEVVGGAQVRTRESDASPATDPAPPMLRQHQPREKKSRFLSLRDLGDHYLLVEEDPAGAARCYQMALRFATEEEVDRQPDPGTWLFRALKLDHNWEKNDAHRQG